MNSRTVPATKQQVKELAKYYGCTVSYSGNERTAFIKGDNNKDAVQAIRAQVQPLFAVVEG